MTTVRNVYDGHAGLQEPPAASIPAPYRDDVADLFDTWRAVRSRNRELSRYYEMKQGLSLAGMNIPRSFEKVNCVVGWCQKAVKVRTVRSVFEGFVFEGESDPVLDDLYERNGMRSLYQRALTGSLVHGVSAMTVMAGREGQPAVKVRSHSANQFAAIWDKDADRVGCGIVLADVDREGRAIRYVLHEPHAVVTLELGEDGRWGSLVEEHPMGRPLMEVFANDPDDDRPMGHSLLSPEMLGIVDKAMRDVLRMEIGAEFFTFPQRYILGASENLFDGPDDPDGGLGSADAAKWRAYLGSYLALTRDENGDIPEVGQFSAATAENFTAMFENDAQRFSSCANVPLNQLGVLSNNYTSSDALSASNDPLILEVERMNDESERTLVEIGRMMLAISNGGDLSSLDEHQRTVRARMTDPSMPTSASRADSWTKWAAADPSVVGTDVWYEGLGLRPATIDRLKAQKQQRSAIEALNEIADGLAS